MEGGSDPDPLNEEGTRCKPSKMEREPYSDPLERDVSLPEWSRERSFFFFGYR